jgi:hypothetical protein
MNDEIKNAIWDGIATKDSLLTHAKRFAEDGDYQSAAKCESEARGAKSAMFAVLNALDLPRPPDMVKALEKWEG